MVKFAPNASNNLHVLGKLMLVEPYVVTENQQFVPTRFMSVLEFFKVFCT